MEFKNKKFALVLGVIGLIIFFVIILGGLGLILGFLFTPFVRTVFSNMCCFGGVALVIYMIVVNLIAINTTLLDKEDES